jgi:hypothetical protein
VSFFYLSGEIPAQLNLGVVEDAALSRQSLRVIIRSDWALSVSKIFLSTHISTEHFI